MKRFSSPKNRPKISMDTHKSLRKNARENKCSKCNNSFNQEYIFGIKTNQIKQKGELRKICLRCSELL